MTYKLQIDHKNKIVIFDGKFYRMAHPEHLHVGYEDSIKITDYAKNVTIYYNGDNKRYILLKCGYTLLLDDFKKRLIWELELM